MKHTFLKTLFNKAKYLITDMMKFSRTKHLFNIYGKSHQCQNSQRWSCKLKFSDTANSSEQCMLCGFSVHCIIFFLEVCFFIILIRNVMQSKPTPLLQIQRCNSKCLEMVKQNLINCQGNDICNLSDIIQCLVWYK